MAGIDEISQRSAHEHLPLDLLQMKVCCKNGIETSVSGIHIGFMETRFYVLFKMPPLLNSKETNNTLSAEEEEWLEYMAFLEEDLHWVLKLPHHRFWSQIVYDADLHRCLESYLAQAPRIYDSIQEKIKENLLNPLRRVHKLIFLVYLRMSTHKESKKYHIQPQAFGEMIYDNFVFDIPKLMDLCALYGFQNSSILCKMIQNIFSTQPKYEDDLNKTSKTILQAFNSIEEKLLDISSNHSNKTESNVNYLGNIELFSYYEVMNFVADVGLTIYAFLESYPPGCEVFHQNGAVLRIPTFYEQVFLTLEKETLKETNEVDARVLEDIKRKIVLSKSVFIKIFRNILNHVYIENILNSKVCDDDEKLSANYLAESFLEVIMELIPNKIFLTNYNLLYPIEADLEIFNEVGIHLDSERLNYLFCIIHDFDAGSSDAVISTIANGARPKVRNVAETNHKPVQNLLGLADTLRQNNSCESNASPAVKSETGLSEVEIRSLIKSVLDILPSYGEGFIERCLENYDYNSEEVINAILTESLPDHLNLLDKNLNREMEDTLNSDAFSILSERKNVFDNDEFDMFSRKVNMENVHFGKKNKVPENYEILQNDDESEYLKQLTLNYAVSDQDEFISQTNLYEDEYDDTYDSAMVGLKEPFLEDEPDEEEEVEENNESNKARPQDFCINPEILRERAEQRRLNNYRGRGGRGGSRPDSSHNRQQKDRHKSHVGNHNRQRQSNFKKSRGMIPI